MNSYTERERKLIRDKYPNDLEKYENEEVHMLANWEEGCYRCEFDLLDAELDTPVGVK
jgi:hypothetical protein